MQRFTRDFGASVVSRGFEMKPNVGRDETQRGSGRCIIGIRARPRDARGWLLTLRVGDTFAGTRSASTRPARRRPPSVVLSRSLGTSALPRRPAVRPMSSIVPDLSFIDESA